jgi:hypothetical protein
MADRFSFNTKALEELSDVGTASVDAKDTEQGTGYGLFDGVDVFVSLNGPVRRTFHAASSHTSTLLLLMHRL